MRMLLRIAGPSLAVVGLVFWLFGGPNLGFTKTSVEITRKDPVTEIPYPDWENRFIPGVEFLAGSFLAGATLFGLSFLGRSKHAKTQTQ